MIKRFYALFEYSQTLKNLINSNVIRQILEDFGITDEPKLLSSGSYGIAYRVGDKVLKFTTHETEAMTANILRQKPHNKYLVNYYDVRELKHYTVTSDEKKPYVILMDYVSPLSNYVFNLISQVNKQAYYKTLLDEFYKNPNNIKTKLEYYNYLDITDYSHDEILKTCMDISNIRNEATRCGIHEIDLHGANLGMKDGHLVLFDVGGFTHKKSTIKRFIDI